MEQQNEEIFETDKELKTGLQLFDSSKCPGEHHKNFSKDWKEKILSNIPDEELAGLSKNQRKKLIKKKIMQETRKEKRKQERERRKAKKKELREAGLEVPHKPRPQDFKDLKFSNYKVVVDLNFSNYMIDNDARMVVKQINACYSLNRKAKNPINFYVSSFTGTVKELFLRLQPGCANWIHFHKKEEEYTELFPKDKLVYLTSDSENVLDTLDENKVYIIGGIVDHNKHKGLCYKLAKEKGIAHARLPISDYVNLATRKVLTINHVFEILSKFLDNKDWKEAFFSVIPKRKGMTDIGDGSDDKKLPENESEDQCSTKDSSQLVCSVNNIVS